MKTASAIRQEFRSLGDSAIAEHSARFFKTGKGEYGEGDRFLGIRVPVIRKVAKGLLGLPDSTILKLLKSRWHEERLLALIIWVNQFSKASEADKERIYNSYLANTQYVNNWDLVDSSAHQIVGGYLIDKNRNTLRQLSQSSSLWERRIAIISTYHFIKQHQFEDTLEIAEILLRDTEDLIHKAVGWMLREVGNRDRTAEEAFLEKHHRNMPRTMLRYAIEKFEPSKRQAYLRS